MEYTYTKNGTELIKSGDFDNAFKVLKKGFYEEGETRAGCFLSQMYYDKRITPRTDVALVKSMLLWYVTMDDVVSSKHKLGVTLYSQNSKEANQYGLNLIQQAAKDDYYVSFCVLGILAYTEKNYQQACSYFEKYKNIENDQKAVVMYANSLMNLQIPDIEKAEKCYKICAENFDDSESYYKLSKIFENPEHLNASKSFAYLVKAAETGYKGAALEVAMAYYCGNAKKSTNPPLDLEKANKYFAIAKSQGEMMADLYMGIICLRSNNSSEQINARKYFCAMQDKGYDCSNEIAFTYYNSDKNQMYEYLLKAFNKENYTYVANLFELAYDKLISIGDNQELLLKIAFACEENNKTQSTTFDFSPLNDISTNLNYVLGRGYYYFNDVCEQNIPLAEQYLNKCLCYSESKYIIGKIAAYGESNIYTFEDAEQLLIEPSNEGIVDAIFVLGKVYRVKQLYSKAVNMYVKAYGKGCKDAALEISDMYINGEVTGKKNKRKAAEWNAKAQ